MHKQTFKLSIPILLQVRNSSTLLFSTLITRIFGVKKGKDEHSKKNRSAAFSPLQHSSSLPSCVSVFTLAGRYYKSVVISHVWTKKKIPKGTITSAKKLSTTRICDPHLIYGSQLVSSVVSLVSTILKQNIEVILNLTIIIQTVSTYFFHLFQDLNYFRVWARLSSTEHKKIYIFLW